MNNSRTKSTKDAIAILQGAVKHLTDRLDRAEMASEELRERVERLKQELWADAMELEAVKCELHGCKLERDKARNERDKLDEFGEYLAKAAERFGENVNNHALICDELACDLDEATNAELAMADSWRALKSAIHGFRKKAKLESRIND